MGTFVREGLAMQLKFVEERTNHGEQQVSVVPFFSNGKHFVCGTILQSSFS